MDSLSAAERGWTRCRSGACRGSESLDHLRWNFLYWRDDECAQLYRHLHRHALPRHVADASAPNLLGLVHYRDLDLVELCRASGCGDSVAARPQCRHQLLRACEFAGKRKNRAARRRVAATVATPVLVLRTS